MNFIWNVVLTKLFFKKVEYNLFSHWLPINRYFSPNIWKLWFPLFQFLISLNAAALIQVGSAPYQAVSMGPESSLWLNIGFVYSKLSLSRSVVCVQSADVMWRGFKCWAVSALLITFYSLILIVLCSIVVTLFVPWLRVSLLPPLWLWDDTNSELVVWRHCLLSE